MPNINKDSRLSSDMLVCKLLFIYFILEKVSSHRYVVPNMERYAEAKCLKFGKSSVDKHL